MTDKKKKLTTNLGNPVGNDQASLTTGTPPFTLLADTHFVEKLAHFNRERIPERVVHAKGAGAFGYFEVTHDVTQYTRADFLSKIGKKTEIFARFSTVGGEKGSADSERDPRGFAVKFYTEEGNYDLVGNNTPVFFIRDALKFPDFIHTQKRDPVKNTKDPDMFWDFLSLTPESIHQVTILFSDRGTPAGYRHINGYGGHTFMMYTNQEEYCWVKIHCKTEQGIKNLIQEEAVELAGKDPDQATRDLFDSIEKGEYPAWKVYIQVMTPEQAQTHEFDPFDVTKVWSQKDYPLIPMGRMVLNRNPQDYFTEVEQAAFSPGNFVPGIWASPDKMLQGRMFAYPDTHRHRLGPNHHMIPVNAPKAANPLTYQRDGLMSMTHGGAPNYNPNSFEPVSTDPSVLPPPLQVEGVVERSEYPLEDKDFFQAGTLYRQVMSEEDRDNLIKNIASHLGNARKRIQLRQTALFFKADKEYGERVAEALGLDMDRVQSLANMTQEERVQRTSRETDQ